MDKAELIRNMTRLTDLFDLHSDLYYRVRTLSTHPQPSKHLIKLFYSSLGVSFIFFFIIFNM